MQDAEIVALYWERNERAIRETERQYGRYLFQIAHNILREREDSRECVNDTYLRAWNSMPPGRPEAAARPGSRGGTGIPAGKLYGHVPAAMQASPKAEIIRLLPDLLAPAGRIRYTGRSKEDRRIQR